jgi:hypothetical protein
VKRRFRAGSADDTVVSRKARKRNERTNDRMSTPIETSTGPHDDPPTAPIPIVGSKDTTDTATEAAKPRRSFLSGLSGVLTAVLVILALVMIGAQFVSGKHEQPGPGLFEVVTHVVAAVVGVIVYRIANRRRGMGRLIGCIVLLAITGALLWYFWWSAT